MGVKRHDQFLNRFGILSNLPLCMGIKTLIQEMSNSLQAGSPIDLGVKGQWEDFTRLFLGNPKFQHIKVGFNGHHAGFPVNTICTDAVCHR